MAKKVASKKKTSKKKVSAKAEKSAKAPKVEREVESIEDLLIALDNAVDQQDKKKIRAKLRSRGHRGGGRQTERKAATAKKASSRKKAATKPSPKRKSKKPVGDVAED